MTEIMKKLSKQDIRNTLAVAWTALSFIFLFKLLTREIPESNKDVVMTIAGVVVGQLVGVIGYYFGQSKSEVDKAKPNEEEI